MKTRVGDDIALVHIHHPRAPFALSSNDNNPMVVTLRNVYYLIDNLANQEPDDAGTGDKKGATPKSKWSTLFSSLKIGGLVIGGLALLSFADKAEASIPELTEEDENAKRLRTEETARVTTPGLPEQTVPKPSVVPEDIQPGADTENVRSPSSTTKDKVDKGSKAALSTGVKDKTVAGGKRKESVDDAVARAARDAGEDVKWLRAMIHLESKGDPRAKNGQYIGLGQIGSMAWEDVQQAGSTTQFPPLTGRDDDPRYDPYTNALATAKLMGLNRKSIEDTAKDAGYKKVTLGLLYAAHNIGATSVKKMLREKDSSKWDEQTKGYINNQASELKQGGVGNYLQNAERSMSKHYASANVDVGPQQVAAAEQSGKMSSVSPSQIAKRVEGSEPSATPTAAASVINVPVQVAKVDPETKPVKRKGNNTQQNTPPPEDAQQNAPAAANRGSSESASASDAPILFRLKNGNMAVM